jgi:alpha-L-fucosidase 2
MNMNEMRMRTTFALLLYLLSSTICHSQSDPGLKLWYDKPSGDTWENALPVGNGRVGAMVYGNVSEDIIQLNEHTVWSGGPNRNDNPNALRSLPEIRRLVFEGRQKEAEKLANEVIISKTSHGQKFQPVGNLILGFPDHQAYANYYRELDIDRAIAKTTYVVGDVTYEREVFTSFADGVIVVQLTASKPGQLSFNATFTSPHNPSVVEVTPRNELLLSGTTSTHEGVTGMVRFRGIARVIAEGGETNTHDQKVFVRNANAATILVSIATNFNSYKDLSGNEVERAEAGLKKAEGKKVTQMRMDHVSAYQQFFHRVKFNLRNTTTSGLPTDQRLKAFATADDPQFVVLYYQFGRYLLISSSQPGGQPANLQGIWNNKMSPPWDSKYTININAEMNYWPAERTNLSELHEPFLRMVKELSETGKETARVMYGTRGWMAHHNTDIWRATGAVDGAFWGNWNAGGGWTSQHLWEHYLYNGDEAYLASVYDILKGAALFYVDFLVEHPTFKWLVVNPGMSPENAPKAHDGSSIDAGATMDTQIVFDVFSTAIRAAGILKRDKSFADSLKILRAKLSPMHVGQHGQLQEWLEDIDDPKDDHRHISHLYGLFPSNQISPYRTPELHRAAGNTLIQRGDISTGWSMGWKVNWWARMLDGNHAFKLIQNQLTPVGTNPGGGGTYNNLFDAHPPFQIDGNFGCTSGITEMLMQSGYDEVHLLPALPDAWPSGRISGIRAKGGFEVTEMQWENAKLVKVIIKSRLGGNLRLRVPNQLVGENGKDVRNAKGANKNPLFYIDSPKAPVVSPLAKSEIQTLKETFVYDISTEPGHEYTLIPK